MRPNFAAVGLTISAALRLHYSKNVLEVYPPGDNDDEPAVQHFICKTIVKQPAEA